MKKIFFSLFFVSFSLAAFCQETLSAEAKEAQAASEIKTELVSKLGLTATATDKIILIENEFHKKLAALDQQKEMKTKEREIKLNEAHVTRRSKLMEIPMTGRQMEEVISIVETIRRKNKF